MVDPADFRSTIRTGSRGGDPLVVVHARTDEGEENRLVGFVVPKREIKRANGRNRVKRQLRHIMRERVGSLPPGARVVVRASGRALGASSQELARRLDGALARAWRKWSGGGGR